VGTVELSVRSLWAFSLNKAYISNLAVSPSQRNKGIAGSLLTKCEQIAFEWGFEEIFLHVLDDNLSAKKLYLKKGYKLEQTDFTLESFVFGRPKKLLLKKKLNPTVIRE
jgi:ribosomal protein S18 acetylase RimI-like enzyme